MHSSSELVSSLYLYFLLNFFAYFLSFSSISSKTSSSSTMKLSISFYYSYSINRLFSLLSRYSFFFLSKSAIISSGLLLSPFDLIIMVCFLIFSYSESTLTGFLELSSCLCFTDFYTFLGLSSEEEDEEELELEDEEEEEVLRLAFSFFSFLALSSLLLSFSLYS